MIEVMYPPVQSRRRSRRGFWVTAVLLLCLVGGGAATYLQPVPQVAAQAATLASIDTGKANIAWPGYGQAAVGAEGFGLLASHGSETPLPIASIAKVITSLALLEKKPLALGQQGPSMTITPADVALYQTYAAKDGSLVPVTLGGQLTEYQMLQAILLPSANNIADGAALWAFGSIDAYLTYANQMLQRHGLTHTAVADDASGFSPNTRSTAGDLVKLGEIALKNPVLAEIMAQKTAVLPMAGVVRNVNFLLGIEGIIGIKTGNTDEAGGCFLYAATYTIVPNRTVTVVAALMGAPSLGHVLADAVPFLQSARSNFTVVDVVQAGQKLGTYDAPWAEPVPVVSAEAISLVSWRGVPVTTRLSFDKVSGARAKNARVGTLTVQAGDTATSHPITLQAAILAPTSGWRLFRNPFDS